MSGGLKKAKGSADDFVTSIKSVAGPIAAAAGAIIGLEAAGAKLVKGWQDNTLAVGDLADKLGVTTEEASALREIAGDLGVPIGSLEMGFKTMAKEGIAPSIEGLIEAKHRIEEAKDPTERMQIATKLLGRAAGDLLPVFKQLNDNQLRHYVETMKAGQVVTAEEVRRARELRDAIDETTDAYEGAKLELGGLIAQKLDLTGRLKNLNEVLSGEISYWDGLAETFGIVTPRLQQLNDESDRARVIDAEVGRLTGMADYYNKIKGGADETAEAIERVGKAELLQRAAEALLAGDTATAQRLVDLAESAAEYEEKLRLTIQALDALNGKRVDAEFLMRFEQDWSGWGGRAPEGQGAPSTGGGGGGGWGGGGNVGQGPGGWGPGKDTAGVTVNIGAVNQAEDLEKVVGYIRDRTRR